MENGEAFFASSGSNVFIEKNDTYFVSGGKKSKLYINNTPTEIPIVQELESTGANSISIYKNNAIIVGGNFAKEDTISQQNCILLNIKSKKIFVPKTPPNGYRSCVAFLNKKTAITCGLNGVDISYDAGKNWKIVSKEGFNVVAKAKSGNAVFFAGSKGRIAKLEK